MQKSFERDSKCPLFQHFGYYDGHVGWPYHKKVRLCHASVEIEENFFKEIF